MLLITTMNAACGNEQLATLAVRWLSPAAERNKLHGSWHATCLTRRSVARQSVSLPDPYTHTQTHTISPSLSLYTRLKISGKQFPCLNVSWFDPSCSHKLLQDLKFSLQLSAKNLSQPLMMEAEKVFETFYIYSILERLFTTRRLYFNAVEDVAENDWL